MLRRIERPRQLPESCIALLRQAKQERPPAATEKELREIMQLSSRCRDVFEEVQPVLFSARPGLAEKRVVQQQELQKQWREYSDAMAHATASDKDIGARLEAALPLCDVLHKGPDAVSTLFSKTAAQIDQARRAQQDTLRAVRSKLEEIDDLASQRRTVVQEAYAQAESDDIRPVLADAERSRRSAHVEEGARPALPNDSSMTPEAASGMVSAAQLDDVLLSEIKKYKTHVKSLEASQVKQDELLQQIRDLRDRLLHDPRLSSCFAEQDREVERLAHAHDELASVAANVHEGRDFYEQLYGLLEDLRRQTKDLLSAPNLMDTEPATAAPRREWGQFTGGAIRFDE